MKPILSPLAAYRRQQRRALIVCWLMFLAAIALMVWGIREGIL